MSVSRCKILPRPKTRFTREELCTFFCELPVADICDAMGRNVALPSMLKPLGKANLLGTAYTVRLPASENLLLYYALDNALPGDVLVVSCAGYEERAVTGEIMVLWAQRKGLAGFVIDGPVRDAEALRMIDFPVFARAVSPNGPYKNGNGEINVPVSIGNVVVNPGDIIVGDEDGIVAVPENQVEEITKTAESIRDNGIKKIDAIMKNGKPNLEWLYNWLKENNLS